MTKQDYTPDWARIKKKYRFVAIDENGSVYAFTNRPLTLSYTHYPAEGDVIQIGEIDPPGENFREMIYERPDGQ